ncbi:MAG: alpha/beta fold hydrolase [Actinomycetota bacterium]|nr:alpha/beta fold hydrolase [Actinomycetota bacterium]
MHDDDVVRGIESLPERFRGEATVEARYRLCIGDIQRDVVISKSRCKVGPVRGKADAEIVTDAATWKLIDEGRLSGIEAFAQRKLSVRGGIERSLHFEPCFDRPDAGALRYSVERIDTGAAKISAVIAGDPHGEPLVLLHGLGASKSSWLTVVPQLAQHYRVIAIDLPGFGASSKPRGRYNARWFADHVFKLLDTLGYGRAFVAGNSMGGRIAQEMAMAEPGRVRGIVCLCPATAFSKRPMLLAARLARAEAGVIVSRLPRGQITDSLRQMFARPSRVEDAWFDAAVEDFLQVWRSPWARFAFFASARNIYLEEPEGDNGFWARLAAMRVPAYYIFGQRDYLISSRFSGRVSEALPNARVEVWRNCGHVPQVEMPDRTARVMLEFFASTRAPKRKAAEAV